MTADVRDNPAVQFSLFGAQAADAVLADLDGLLLAGGQWVRAERGWAARLSVLVDRPWRVDALLAELDYRGLSCDTVPAPGGLIAVRTPITELLCRQAERWTRGAALRVPPDLALSASGLRLWAIAGGRSEETGYLLSTPGERDDDSSLHRAAGRQLAGLGIPAAGLTGRGGPGWRITSARRLRRLAELLGEPPAGADWPVG
ncbi:MAG TPA: hypothetical protein VJ851_11400 [Jatrophihabitans sp.]|nr:hypothetical protein [Jatrophihabitans sp.]